VARRGKGAPSKKIFGVAAQFKKAAKIMRLFAMAGLLVAQGCWAQEQGPISQERKEQVQDQSPQAATEKQVFLIPEGTKVPLTLTNPIRTRAVRSGDSVRAVTTFPLTIGTQVMIPPGTYVEGALERVIKRDSTGHPGLQIHFTRIVFSNGYAVALDGVMAQARVGGPVKGSTEISAAKSQSETSDGLGGGLGGGLDGGMGFQQPPGPTPPPLPPMPGPRIGTVMGITAGVTAAGIISAILLHRHRGDDALFDAGWQFEMVLQSPLSLDADRVAAALAESSAK
jgi:hypothetical protein